MFVTGRSNEKHGVRIGEYGSGEQVDCGESNGNGIVGWVEPACERPAWILWFCKNGDGYLYAERSYENGDTGAVVGDPIKLKAVHRSGFISDVPERG